MMPANRGEGAMQLIMQLEEKVRDKNNQIQQLKKHNSFLVFAGGVAYTKGLATGLGAKWIPLLICCIISGAFGAWVRGLIWH
jgi:fatty acid desaturase